MVEKTDDIISAKFIVGYVYVQVIYNVFRRILQLNSIGCLILLGTMLAILCVKYVPAIIKILSKKNSIYLAMTELLCCILYCVSYIRGDLALGTFLSYIAYTAILCIPFYFIIKNMSNKSVLYSELRKKSYTILLILLMLVPFFSDYRYIMSYAYWVLLVALIHINEFIEKWDLFNFVVVVVEFVIIALMGSRGSLLCFGLYVLLRVFIFRDLNKLKCFFLILIVFFVFCYDIIGSLVLTLMADLGIQSRTIELLFTNISYVSSRDIIQEKAILYFKENIFVGNGVARDISLIGMYPHNIFIEILFDFGIIVGGVICILLFFMVCKAFRAEKKQKIENIFYLCYAFFPLMVSGTYLKSSFFWIFLAIIHSSREGVD